MNETLRSFADEKVVTISRSCHEESNRVRGFGHPGGCAVYSGNVYDISHFIYLSVHDLFFMGVPVCVNNSFIV